MNDGITSYQVFNCRRMSGAGHVTPMPFNEYKIYLRCKWSINEQNGKKYKRWRAGGLERRETVGVVNGINIWDRESG